MFYFCTIPIQLEMKVKVTTSNTAILPPDKGNRAAPTEEHWRMN